MDTYPLLGRFDERKWRQDLRKNEKIKSLFKQVVNEATIKEIPLTSITGHDDIISTVAHVRHIDQQFGKGETLLHWAASYEPANASATSKVLVLLLLGADPNIQDHLGRTPLHWAVNHDCSDIAEDSDIQYERRSKIDAAKVVNHLLSFNANPNIVDIYGASPLCHAVWSKTADIADILRPLTSERIIRAPEFFFVENENYKSIRCSHVDQWIQENTSSVTENIERLQHLLSSPGIGLLHHGEEIKMQKEQVIALFKRLSSNIKKEDPLLEFVPTLAGSMSEGTKCQKPDEQDIILRLTKFEDMCIPEESEHAPCGVITLKFIGNDTEANEYQKYILDGYLNREEILYSLITKIEKELSSISFWSENDIINIYPTHDTTVELKPAIGVGDIGNLTFIWHGKYYKQVKLSVDVVPAIIVKQWQPENAITEDPTGRAVPNETFLILRAFIEDFDYDLEIHGDLNSDNEATGVDYSSLEFLNGQDWDSASDCISEKSDDDCDKDPVNALSDFYSTGMVRWVRNDTGYSIPKSMGMVRKIESVFTEIYEVQETNKRIKTAKDKDAILYPFEKHHRSDAFKVPFEFAKTEENEDIGQHCEKETKEQKTASDHLEMNTPKVNKQTRYDSSNTSEVRASNDRLPESIYETSNRTNISDSTDNEAILCKPKDNEYASGLRVQSGGVVGMNNCAEGANRHEAVKCERENQEDDMSSKLLPVKGSREASEKQIVQTNIDQNRCNGNNMEHDVHDENLIKEFVQNVIASFDGLGEVNFEQIEENHMEAKSADYPFTVHFDKEGSSDEDSSEDETDDSEDSEEPREDMGFRISYSKWENETMAAFPQCIKTAYMLSKILVSYVPKVRTPLNRGINKNMKGFSSVKDIFSYLLKMALFTVVRKNRDHHCLTTDPDIQDRIRKTLQSEENTTTCAEQVIYSRTGDHHMSKDNKEGQTTKHLLSSNELLQIAFWVKELFSEIDTAAETGHLATYFDPKINILDRIANSGKQKGKPYPAMLYLRKHCKMIKSLVRIKDEKVILC